MPKYSPHRFTLRSCWGLFYSLSIPPITAQAWERMVKNPHQR